MRRSRACSRRSRTRSQSAIHYRNEAVPSLIRFLVYLGLLAGLVYGGLYGLANYVKVTPREITRTITLPKAGK